MVAVPGKVGLVGLLAGGALLTAQGLTQQVGADAVSVGAAQARERGYFDFRFDLPPDEELRALAERVAWSSAPHVAQLPVLLAWVRCRPWVPDEESASVEFGHSDAWPECVRRRLHEEIERLEQTSAKVEGIGTLYGAWRGSLLDGTEVYVVEANTWGMFSDFLVTVRDARLDAAAPCVTVSGRWMYDRREGEPPPVRQLDLDGDGRMELACGTVDHNGTVTRNDVLEIFELLPGPELRQVLRFDQKAWISVASPNEEGFVLSALARDKDGGLLLRVWYECPPFGTPPVPIGEVRLIRAARGARYESGAVRALLPGTESFLKL